MLLSQPMEITMNAKKSTKAEAAETAPVEEATEAVADPVGEEIPASSAAAPQPAGEAQTPAPEEDNPAHIDTTHAPDPVAEQPIIDIVDDNLPIGGKTVIGGGADMTLGEPASPIGVTAPLVAPVEDVSQLSTARLPQDELAKLDVTDSSRAAAIRRQETWVQDAEKIFKGPTAEQLEKDENLRQMDELDARERKRVEAENIAKGIASDRETAAAQIKALETEYAGMVERAKAIKLELERLTKIAAGGDEPRDVEAEPEKEAA